MKAPLATAFVLVACAAREPHSPEAQTSAAAPSPPGASSTAGAKEERDPAPAEERHDDDRATSSLEVPGFGPALVVPAVASKRPAAVLVGAHGAGDSPEWQCEHWGSVSRGRYFVLCPRGKSLGGSGYYYANHIELEKEVVAALAALRKRYGDGVRPGGGVYTGYSQGATMGALMVVDHGADFPHLVLVEGGWGDWTLGRAKRFAATGGKNVALVCGGTGCMHRARAATKVLERAGLRARAELVEGGGHTYVGAVGERATEIFERWLFATDR